MLFYHLFFMKQNVEQCSSFFYINGVGLVNYISRMANPVPIFMMLSGYGLYAVYKKGDKHRWSRLLKLMIHYWIILLIFVSIGLFLYPNKYPGSISNIISNITAFHTTYNGEHWFIFPYILLAISSPFIFKACDKYNISYVLGISFILYLGSCFLISRYGDRYLFTNMLVYHPVLYCSLLFDFILGAIACKCGWLNRSNNKILRQWAWGILLSLCIIRCLFTTGAFHNLFLFAFIWIWQQTTRPKWIDKTLAHLGKHSMNMWLIHTFFCYYLFHDWIYGFKYPLVIFTVLIIVSYVSSHIINLIYLLLFSRLVKTTHIK